MEMEGPIRSANSAADAIETGVATVEIWTSWDDERGENRGCGSAMPAQVLGWTKQQEKHFKIGFFYICKFLIALNMWFNMNWTPIWLFLIKYYMLC